MSYESDAVLARFREYTVGPTRFMNLLSCFELGFFDALRGSPGLTASEIGAATGVTAHAVEQMLELMVKEDFVSRDEATGTYALAGIGAVTDEEFARVKPWMDMVKVVCLRQLYYLTESVREGKVVGLRELYGFDGTLYEACAENEDLRVAWAGMMDQVTSLIDHWFFDNVTIEDNARVLDLAGNTGLGAVLTHKLAGAAGLHVTCFDFPEKEAAATANFRAHGLAERCSFVGGNVFDGLPTGFDIVMIKHFLDMFDRENVLRILKEVHSALDVGGQVYVLVPVYPENPKESYSIDILPAYFLGCTMGEGGPQRVSTYKRWLEEAGFKVTKAMTQDIESMPPDALPLHGILCATKMD